MHSRHFDLQGFTGGSLLILCLYEVSGFVFWVPDALGLFRRCILKSVKQLSFFHAFQVLCNCFNEFMLIQVLFIHFLMVVAKRIAMWGLETQ